MKKIVAAQGNSGTMFYAIDSDVFSEIILNTADESINIWQKYLIRAKGLGAVDINHMYGSKIIDDTLYICVTDGEDVEIDEDMIDPEEVLDTYTIEAVSDSHLLRVITDTDVDLLENLIEYIAFNDPDFNKEIEDALELFEFTDLADVYEAEYKS